VNKAKTYIINENPLLILVLGLCPALAMTTRVADAFVMGVCVLFVLLGSNLLVSLFRNWIPQQARQFFYILITGVFVTIVEIVMESCLPVFFKIFGLYIPLIVVNCMVLGRAESFAIQNKTSSSILDALGSGLGYMLALILISLIREVLGNGTITINRTIKVPGFTPLKIMIFAPGAFLVTGYLIALFKGMGRKFSK